MKLLTCQPHLFFMETSEKQLLLSNYNNLTKSKKFNCAFLPESNMVKSAAAFCILIVFRGKTDLILWMCLQDETEINQQ